MRRILSERNFVILLFVTALVVFVIAQQDTKRIEKTFMNPDTAVSTLSPSNEASLPEKVVDPATSAAVIAR